MKLNEALKYLTEIKRIGPSNIEDTTALTISPGFPIERGAPKGEPENFTDVMSNIRKVIGSRFKRAVLANRKVFMTFKDHKRMKEAETKLKRKGYKTTRETV